MWYHSKLDSLTLKNFLLDKKIQLGGNKCLKIYGTLSCSSGKRMKKENRIFFCNEDEAIQNGYRPCGHCMRDEYLVWKVSKNQVENPSSLCHL